MATGRRWARRLLGVLGVLALLGAIAWHRQSVLIGRVAEWYLGRVAEAETTTGKLDRRREILTGLNRQLLMPPPADALVPELYDLVTLVSSRVATGEISLNWVAYLYTAYHQDMVRQRPTGVPRRTLEEVRAELDRQVAFYAIRKRPDGGGITVGDVLGTGDDVITLDEIESGKDIDLRTRGTK